MLVFFSEFRLCDFVSLWFKILFIKFLQIHKNGEAVKLHIRVSI